MIIERNQTLKNTGKKTILYDSYQRKANTKKQIIIFCHGYKGFKDWGAWDIMAKRFANAGFFFLKFNFSHNGGTAEQPIDFPDLEAFAKNNYTIELDDLDRIITFICKTRSNQLALDKINIIGHSRGGGIVAIKGEEDSRVTKIITWASVCDYKSRFKIETPPFEKWKKEGRMFVENGRTKQQMPHDWQFYNNFVENEDRLTIKRALKALNKPLLIIHGDTDASVNLEEAMALKEWYPKAVLEIIKGADHVFNTKHPWNKNEIPKQLEIVFAKTVAFINNKV